ncbi:MAG: lipopolysaccharide assembly LapA domain-containing protein [Jatrophihabitans sp.]|uniref:LapA family protein n=1 Tax=Jatrophihabitans sp. TaxID=1932789 RepID=UPI003916BD1D
MTDQGQYYQPQNQPSGPPGAGPGTGAGAGGRTKRPVSVGQILGGLLFVLVIIFIIENSRKVKIRLIIPEVKAPLYVAILIAAVLGSVITWLLRYRRHRNHPPKS